MPHPLTREAIPMDERTVEQFGEQWQRFTHTGGTFGSQAVLADICGPLLPLAQIQGRRVLEVGSGNGRIVKMLLDAGAAHVTAAEPSSGIDSLRQNLGERAERVECLRVRGEELPELDAELAFCIGVLHHLEDPLPAVRRVREVLRPGGRFLIWVYGREGNACYILFAETLRRITRVLPDAVLAALAHALTFFLGIYVVLCRHLPLPLGSYMREVMSRFNRQERFFLIFDQLNCGYAKYYTGDETRRLLEDADLQSVRLHHRHGMSWTAIGEKPGGPTEVHSR